MPVFIILTRLAGGSLRSPEQLEKKVVERIETEIGRDQVKWLGNYAALGPYDYLDILEAPNIETATKVSTLIRTFGHAHTEDAMAAVQGPRSQPAERRRLAPLLAA